MSIPLCIDQEVQPSSLYTIFLPYAYVSLYVLIVPYADLHVAVIPQVKFLMHKPITIYTFII